jgi:hypothetical protein
MIAGMTAMYVAMAGGPTVLPAGAWIRLSTVVAVAIVGWMFACGARERPFSFLWWPALVQQLAMVYMWTAAGDQAGWLTGLLAAYFVLEALAWLVIPARGQVEAGASSVESGSGVEVRTDRVAAPIGRVGLATMAAAMGYMFVGMQLLM